MFKKPHCSECASEITAWDSTRDASIKAEVVNSTVGEFGIVGAFFSLLTSFFMIFRDHKEGTIWQCKTCQKKYTGEKLKPFEWSDYE